MFCWDDRGRSDHQPLFSGYMFVYGKVYFSGILINVYVFTLVYQLQSIRLSPSLPPPSNLSKNRCSWTMTTVTTITPPFTRIESCLSVSFVPFLLFVHFYSFVFLPPSSLFTLVFFLQIPHKKIILLFFFSRGNKKNRNYFLLVSFFDQRIYCIESPEQTIFSKAEKKNTTWRN